MQITPVLLNKKRSADDVMGESGIANPTVNARVAFRAPENKNNKDKKAMSELATV